MKPCRLCAKKEAAPACDACRARLVELIAGRALELWRDDPLDLHFDKALGTQVLAMSKQPRTDDPRLELELAKLFHKAALVQAGLGAAARVLAHGDAAQRAEAVALVLDTRWLKVSLDTLRAFFKG